MSVKGMRIDVAPTTKIEDNETRSGREQQPPRPESRENVFLKKLKKEIRKEKKLSIEAPNKKDSVSKVMQRKRSSDLYGKFIHHNASK